MSLASNVAAKIVNSAFFDLEVETPRTYLCNIASSIFWLFENVTLRHSVIEAAYFCNKRIRKWLSFL